MKIHFIREKAFAYIHDELNEEAEAEADCPGSSGSEEEDEEDAGGCAGRGPGFI
jgi:hypothetical protein